MTAIKKNKVVTRGKSSVWDVRILCTEYDGGALTDVFDGCVEGPHTGVFDFRTEQVKRKRKSWSKETIKLFGEFDFYEHKFLLIKSDNSQFFNCDGYDMSGVEWLLQVANDKKMYGPADSFFRSIIETEERLLRLVTQKTKIDTDWDHWLSL
jgi:hypothetical protein